MYQISLCNAYRSFPRSIFLTFISYLTLFHSFKSYNPFSEQVIMILFCPVSGEKILKLKLIYFFF